MNWKKWIVGLVVAVVFGLLSAGAGLAAGMHWTAFIAVLCTSMATHLGAYLMKHPIEEVKDDVPPFRPPVWTIPALLAFALLFAGTACKTPKLEAGGAYAPTNNVGQVVVNDVGLALADASYKFAYETTLSVFRFERENRTEIWKLAPGVKRELDKLRPQVVAIDKRWALARQAYQANPTPAGLTTIQTILSEIQRLLPVVQSQLAPMNQALTTAARTE